MTKKVANYIIEKEGRSILTNRPRAVQVKSYIGGIYRRRGVRQKSDRSLSDDSEVKRETERCLECDILCSVCVEVCPNRANFPIKMGSGRFKDAYQILHIDGLCNQCGNCDTFCPYQGNPYRDRLTLFWDEADFYGSENDGFIFGKDSKNPVCKLGSRIFYGSR